MFRLFLIMALMAFGSAPAHAQLGKLMEKLGVDKSDDDLDDDTVASGLKEALRVGTGNTVDITGQVDGYFGNEAIKILLPDNIQKAERGLRMAGFGDQLDEFVLSMNRAAEKAAPFARDIFWGAIKEMTISDARGILTGGDTAATEYFRDKTSDRLTEAFRPIVNESMEDVGVTRQYQAISGKLKSIPFMRADDMDLDSYVVGKALDGLFHVLGEEEKKIRQNPAARVTDLLQKVFGR